MLLQETVQTNFKKNLAQYFYDLSQCLGDDENNKEALNYILQKVVEDPQSGSCLNISYSEIQVKKGGDSIFVLSLNCSSKNNHNKSMSCG